MPPDTQAEQSLLIYLGCNASVFNESTKVSSYFISTYWVLKKSRKSDLESSSGHKSRPLTDG